MSFPSEATLAKMRKKLAKMEGFLALDQDADELSRFRFSICQNLLKYAKKHDLSTTEMAEVLGITKADMSRIFNHRVERFTTDRLVRLYAIIKPHYKLKVS